MEGEGKRKKKKRGERGKKRVRAEVAGGDRTIVNTAL